MDLRENKGILFGFFAATVFAFTLPTTRFAVDYFHPIFLGAGRSALAGFVAMALLAITRQPLPKATQIKELIWIAGGIVIGFPNLVSLAMKTVPAGQGGVILALLPLGTALVGALITTERPSIAFWLSGLLGCGVVVTFSLLRTTGYFQLGDLLLLGAVIVTAVGYAMGAKLSRTMGGWQVTCWAAVICLPITFPVGLWSMQGAFAVDSTIAWICFFYTAFFSQLIGFFLWYYALALGGIARVSQIIILMPFMTIFISMIFLNEPFDMLTIVFACLVVATVILNRMTRIAV